MCFREPPMIITTLIGMFMSVGAVGQDQSNAWDKCRYYLFESQESLQFIFLMVALVCVPWLFCVEPILVYRHHQAEVEAKQRHGHILHTSADSAGEDDEE